MGGPPCGQVPLRGVAVMVMQQMRSNTKIIMLVTAAAFIGLMVFSWGMDATGRSSGSLGEIGRVNGTAVQYDEYMAVYQNIYQQVQAGQQEPVTTQQNKEIEQQAWDQMVDRILIRDELERRGIDVTDEEVRQAARFQPPTELRSNPAFMTDGAFDLVKYQQYLTDNADPNLFLQLEAYYRDQLPQGKLFRQVGTGVFVSDAELWERYRDAYETVQARFVALDPEDRIPNDSVTVTDDEIEKYWDDHQDEFEMPARASVKALVLPRTPTAADTAAARARVAGLLAELRAGANFDTVGARELRAARPAVVEDLGTFERGRMTPVFDTAVFEAPVGRVSGPIETSFGHHIVLVSKRTADSVTAKHILIQVTRTEESEDALLALADSMEDLSESQTIEEVGRTMGLTVQTENITDAFPFVTGAGQISDGSDWAFEEAVPGDLSEVFENTQSFYLLELVSSQPGGIQPLADATPAIRQILGLEKKVALATETARALVTQVRGGTTLDNAAASLGLTVQAPEPFARQDFVAGLGVASAPVGAAFGLAPGKVSDPVATNDNVFVIEKIAQTPADSSAFAVQKDEQRRQIIAVLRQQRLQQWMEGLRSAATIVDRRKEVLTPVDDTTQVFGVNRLPF